MDERSLGPARRSLGVIQKPRLDPHCSVFPDPVHPPNPPPPPPPPTSSLPSPIRQSDSQYDYFSWRPSSHVHESAAPSLTDPSFTAPVGALNDDDSNYSRDKGLQLGAWYAFMKGFHSKIGSVVFADQNCYRRCRSIRHGRGRGRLQPDGEYGDHADRLNCTGHDRDSKSCHSSCIASDGDASRAGDDFSGSVGEQIYEGHSDSEESDDACEQYIWNTRAPQCLVTSVSQNQTSRTEILQGDITAEQAANGMDVQGIPWESLPFSREDYRATRMRANNGNESQEVADNVRNVLQEPRRGAQFFDFFKNTRRVKCSIVHFQLRNLAWATSKHDVFVMHEGAVLHWDAAAKRKTQVLDLSGSGIASASGLGMVQISTMIAKDDLVIAGGFYGEVVAKNLKTGSIIHNKRITYDENAITNAIDIFGTTVMTSNNDCYVRCFDMNTFERRACFAFEKPVNHATRQPEGKLVAVAGDGNPIQVIDGDNGERVAQLHGHGHFSFATGWHPNGRMFATGSQDKTCRVWDVRNMSQSFAVLGAHIGAVRSLRFSACGRFLVMAEPRDFVHIFDVNRGEFDVCQEIDLFGEIAGIALTPSAEGLFIAVCDRTYSSLIEYERRSGCPLSNMVF